MLDNMSVANIKKAALIRNKLSTLSSKLSTKLEVSGGVTLDNIRSIAKTGADMKQNVRRATSPSLIFILDLLPFAQRALGDRL